VLPRPDDQARRAGRDDERGDARVRATGLGGADAREDDEARRVARIGDEELFAGDPPAGPVRARGRAQRGRIRAGGRLGEAERAEAATLHQPGQPDRLLFGGPEADDRARDDAAVHRDADRERWPRRRELFQDQDERHRARPEAAVLRRNGHPEDPEPAELADDVLRKAAGRLGGRDPGLEPADVGGGGGREVALVCTGEREHRSRPGPWPA